MITQQVMERVAATKLREKHFLTFLKYCGEFYKEEAFINEKDFVLDVSLNKSKKNPPRFKGWLRHAILQTL